MCCVGNCGDCCVGNCSNCTDCGDKAAIEQRKHDKEVANELAKMRADMKAKSQAFELDIVRSANSPVLEIMEVLRKANRDSYGDKKLAINLDYINRKVEKNNEQIKGLLGRYYADQLNTANPELQAITSQRDKDKRNKAYNEYIQKIEVTGKRKLGTKVEAVMKENLDLIKSEVSKRLIEVSQDLKKAENEYRAIQVAGQKSTEERELLKAKYLYQLEVYNIMNQYVSKEV